MRVVPRLAAVVILLAGLSGCDTNTAADSDPPPGVRKNETRSTGLNDSKKGKPFLVEKKK